MVTPSATDTYTYNGLGLRVGKTNSTGIYSYVCDGTTPGSPVLIDGHTLYTPGLSENRGGTSVYYDFDRLGNLWTADGTGKSQYAAVDYSAFGITLSGSAGTPFGYGGANGCQTDLDASLVLMGHRYFDPRTGRFISQDPAGSGDNWYAYADNNPINEIDPGGLMPLMSFPEGSSPQGTDMPVWAAAENGAFREFGTVWHKFTDGTSSQYETPGVSHVTLGYYWASDASWGGGGSLGAGMAGFANNYHPMTDIRPPNWLGNLLQTLGAAAAILHGGIKPTGPIHLPPIAREAKPGKTVEEKDGEKPGGSKFSLRNFEGNMNDIARLGSGLMDELNYDIDRMQKQQQRSYAPFTLGGSAAEFQWL